MTSILESSRKLRGVQGELQKSFSINGFCLWVVCNAVEFRIDVFC